MTQWPTAKLKYVARFAYGDALPADREVSEDVPVYGSNGAYAFHSVANTKGPAIIVGRKGSYGKVNWSNVPCFASDTTFFIDEITTQNNLRWVYWLLQTLRLDEGSDEAAVPGLNRETAYENTVAIPPLSRQCLIADYLDRETTRLDALVAAKERLFELLEDKRRALITRAVTRGLNPNAPFRETGITWLRQIPAHWHMAKLKHISYIYYGLSQPPEYQTEGLPFVRATNIKKGRILPEGMAFVDATDLPKTRVVRLRVGDIIVVRSGAYTGDSALVTQEWTGGVAGYDMVVRLKGDVFPSFLSYAMLCPYVLEAQIDPLRMRAAQPHLNAKELGDVLVLLPPADEQSVIAKHIEQKTGKLDSLRQAAERTIGLLKERRAALISDAVKGKIKSLS